MRKVTFTLVMLAVTAVMAATAWAAKPIKQKTINIEEAKIVTNAPKKAAAPSWSESFEAWPDADKQTGKNYFWLPEGWTRQATPEYMTEENPHTWFVNTQTNPYVPAPIDGRVYAEIMYNTEPQDEWLYTPALTPQAGEWLQYYVIFRPFLLFDFSKYDHKTDTFTEYVTVGNLQTYVSVDGGEYQLVADLAEEYKTADVHEISESYHNGEILNKKVSIDMTPYVGHTVKVGFRYVATDGDSMWLDALTLGKPDMEVGYAVPESSLYLGMPMDMSDAPAVLYLPDNTPLTWWNTSSQEAQTFEWSYPSQDDYSVLSTSTERDLTTTFNVVSAANNTPASVEPINTPVPVLKAIGIAGLQKEYTNDVSVMQIGGKAVATTAHPLHGVTITSTQSGYPIFGYVRGVESPWKQIFGMGADDEAHVSGILNAFPKPAKPAKVRGLWVQGAGKLTAPAFLKVGAYRKNVYGSLDEEAAGIAVLDVQNIYSEPIEGAEGMYYYSIPFIFADPLEVNEALWYRLEGVDKAFDYFAPLQDEQPADFAHGYVDISFTYDGDKGMNTYSIGNLEISGVPCNNSFFFNLNMAYGDCDDWGHIDIEQPEPEMPEFNIQPNTMQVINLNGDEMLNRQLPMRCGFYKTEDDMLTLYPAIGELYTYEGGAFYTDDLPRTYYYEIKMPRALLGTEQQVDGANGISVRYYDILREEWMVNATSGTITVTEKANGTYAIDLKVLDSNSYNATAMNFNTDDTWRWRKYGEMRPNPNIHKLSRSGKDYEVHQLNSCVMDTSDDTVARLYFCTTPNVTTVAQMQQLPADDQSLVEIEITRERMNGYYLSFSMTRNDPSLVLNIHYNGEEYNSSRSDLDGGNACIEYDAEAKTIDASSMLFSLPSPMINNGYPNWSLKYNGTYSEDDGTTAITHVEADNRATAPLYNLAGQRVNSNAKGFIIKNGKKYINKIK